MEGVVVPGGQGLSGGILLDVQVKMLPRMGRSLVPAFAWTPVGGAHRGHFACFAEFVGLWCNSEICAQPRVFPKHDGLRRSVAQSSVHEFKGNWVTSRHHVPPLQICRRDGAFLLSQLTFR